MVNRIWNLKNFNFLKNCFAGPNKTWYPLPDVVFVLASSFWQIVFVKWKLLPFVQIVSSIIIVLCDNNRDPFEFISSTIVWNIKTYHFVYVMAMLSFAIFKSLWIDTNTIQTWTFQSNQIITSFIQKEVFLNYYFEFWTNLFINAFVLQCILLVIVLPNFSIYNYNLNFLPTYTQLSCASFIAVCASYRINCYDFSRPIMSQNARKNRILQTFPCHFIFLYCFIYPSPVSKRNLWLYRKFGLIFFFLDSKFVIKNAIDKF